MIMPEGPCSGEGCSNRARYTTIEGKRTCALCAMGKLALKDSDIPKVIKAIYALGEPPGLIPTSMLHVLRELRELLGRIE